MKEADLEVFYESLAGIYQRALEDVHWHLDIHIREHAPSDTARIYTTAKISKRVKSKKSLWRKCKRDDVPAVGEIHERVEDVLGIRIATPNKEQAFRLYEYFRSLKDDWFCPVVDSPEFVPYTITDKNRYSLETGYQAYHMTFAFDKSYRPATTLRVWPVEIQIMSQLWEFWANYSREYFYGGTGSMADALLPYNVVISKILDNADDLMVATTDILLRGEREEEEAEGPQEPAGRMTTHDVRLWFTKNISKYFGPRVRIPIDLFLSKVAEELNLYDVGLDDLEKILDDSENQRAYDSILEESRIDYLPPYQQILCRILIENGWELERVVDRVNEELWVQGIELRAPENR
jgi:ppGpp synthetase/RelA/SpoT-type nucleotidyltranferase